MGEVCFNTAMTGYQEILTDPSYAGQIVAFTFPHIGIVGTNSEDIEALTPVVRGLVVRADASQPSNYRALSPLDRWLKLHNIPGIAGIDTRALTNRIRENGMPHGVVAMSPDGEFDRRRAGETGARFSGAGRSRSRQGRELPAAIQLERNAVGVGRRLMASRKTRRGARWFSTTA